MVPEIKIEHLLYYVSVIQLYQMQLLFSLLLFFWETAGEKGGLAEALRSAECGVCLRGEKICHFGVVVYSNVRERAPISGLDAPPYLPPPSPSLLSSFPSTHTVTHTLVSTTCPPARPPACHSWRRFPTRAKKQNKTKTKQQQLLTF